MAKGGPKHRNKRLRKRYELIVLGKKFKKKPKPKKRKPKKKPDESILENYKKFSWLGKKKL